MRRGGRGIGADEQLRWNVHLAEAACKNGHEHQCRREPHVALHGCRAAIVLVRCHVSIPPDVYGLRLAGLRYWAATRLYNFDGRALRKQYYFRESERGLLAWDVDRLCELSRGLPRKSIPLKNI